MDVINGYKWELYHVDEDFSEAVNLAAKNPEKLQELQLLFYAEAAKYNVLPLDDSKVARMDVSIRPSLTRGRTEFTYYGGLTRIPEGAAPDVKNKSFRITAEVDLPKGEEQGVVVTQGGLCARLGAACSRTASRCSTTTSPTSRTSPSPPRTPSRPASTPSCSTSGYDGGGLGKGGDGTLSVDGKTVAQGRIEQTMPLRFCLRRNLRRRRGHRHARQPGLRRALQVHRHGSRRSS